MGATTTLFLYVFINVAMVIGLIPVVGVPLPLVSYGGTEMLTILVGFGRMMNVYIHSDLPIGRHGAALGIGGGPVRPKPHRHGERREGTRCGSEGIARGES